MAQNKNLPLQNTSYTNKDFESVYSELLELVKQITYKWDPSISNESDPGVILLKLVALLADKLDYNTDKNVLECFPLSVTQEQNARQLFEQLGYYMKWYNGATTNVTIKWAEETSETSYTIPAFTMVTDYDREVVYSLIGPSTAVENEFIVGSQKLKCDGSITSFKAIEGVSVKYDINGNSTIKVSNLDNKNRLYFNTTDIAQNGIFITNVGKNNYSEWKQKDNLVVEQLGNRFYRFGLTEDGNTCFLEFPEDVDSIFEEGIQITYIKTLGVRGNIAANILEKFYNDLIPAEDTKVTLNESNVKLFNTYSAVNGRDPETIDEAYTGYKKTIGTFNTIITLRDYINKLLTSGLVSNCFVCDRTNDIQQTYDVMSLINNVSQNKHIIEVEDGKPSLSAYSLKLYLLQYVRDVTTIPNFNATFNMMTATESENVKAYIEDLKAIQHDYVDIQSATNSEAHFCYFKNKYPIKCNIITQYSLSETEADEMSTNIRTALLTNLNATKVEFGEAIGLDKLQDIILNADNRIKSVMIDNLEYTAYAVIFDGNAFREYNITDNAEIQTSLTSTGITSVSVNKLTFLNKAHAVDGNSYKSRTFTCTAISPEAWEDADGDSVTLAEYGVSYEGTAAVDDEIEFTVPVEVMLMEEIWIKSIISGVTPLLVHDEKFDYVFNQELTQVIDNVERMSSNVNITFNQDTTEYVLRQNENIQFYAPNLIDAIEYSNYVKYEYCLNNYEGRQGIAANSDYELQANEYVALYWKETEDEDAIYKYCMYGQGNIIKPSFNLPVISTPSERIVAFAALKRNIGTQSMPIYVSDSKYNGDMSETLSNQISELTTSNYILSGNKKITKRVINQITLNSSDYYCYWALNTSSNNKYVLFEAAAEYSNAATYNVGDVVKHSGVYYICITAVTVPEEFDSSKWSNDKVVQTRLLESGEYFFYSNADLTDLVILGAGTELTRDNVSTTWAVNTADLADILTNGISALTDKWFQISSGSKLAITENQFITVGPNCTVKLEPLSSSLTSWSVVFNSSGIISAHNLSEFKVGYKLKGSDEYTYLDNITIENHSGWSGRSLLSIACSNKEEQVVLDNQSITLYIKDSNAVTITGAAEDTINNNLPVVIKSALTISDTSGEVINTFMVDSADNRTYNSIYQYKKYLDNSNVSFNSLGYTVLDFDTSTSSISLTTRFPEGDYILPLCITNTNFSTLGVKLGTKTLHSIYSSSETNFNGNKTYPIYLDMHATFSTSHTLTFTMTGQTEDIKVLILNPVRYTFPAELDSTFADRLLHLLPTWDTNNDFDYTYATEPEASIANPLEPKSFLNTNHIFNKYVICQLDTSSIPTTGDIRGKQ